MRFRALAVVTMLVAISGAAGLSAQGRGQGRGRGGNTGSGDPDVSISVAAVFGSEHRTTFADYFRRNRLDVEALPPGIAKNVARGKPLPPGIAKKALPNDLVKIVMRNSRVPRDTTFAIVGDVIVATRRGVVVDVMTGVFR